MAHFGYEGHKLAYTIHGKGPRTTILMPGLLLSQKMQMPLAGDLASHGNRVVTFDFLGHGASDRPHEMWRYSIAEFARQALALLDHLELDQAVVGGTSLGANTTLELAAVAPERLRGMVIEMPVLDNAIPACAAAFTPLLFALVIGHPRDPVHPFSDADQLAGELSNARLIDANSIVELRVRPARLTAKIAEFVDTCWGAR